MKFILAMSLFMLVSSISIKKRPVFIGLSSRELCPNLGQIPQSQIPIGAVYQNGATKNHVVIFSQTKEKLLVPIQLITNAKKEIQTLKEWENFSNFYRSVCGEKPPFLPKNLLTKNSAQKQQFSNRNLITHKNKKANIEGLGKVLRTTEKHVLLEGRVIYNQKLSPSSIIMEDGIFLVKGQNFKLSQNSLVSLNLKYLGQFYDSKLKIRIPVYEQTHDL